MNYLRRLGARLLLVTLLACVCGNDAAAAGALHPGHYLFRSYGIAQGLPDVGISSLLQDRMGFIWAATEDGLYRYDGHRFDVFGIRDGLASTAIRAMHEDAQGTLWIGTAAGLCRWNGQHFEIVAVDDGRTDLDVRSIASTRDALWVATSAGPFRSTTNGNALQAVPGWSGGAATVVYFERDAQRMWVARWNDRAEILFYRDNAWHAVEFPGTASGARIGGIAGDGQGNIWVRQPAALYVTSGSAARFVAAPMPQEMHARARSGGAFLFAGTHGDLWVPLDTGLLHYSSGSWEFLDVGSSVGTPWTRAVLEDRDGSLWIGSMGLHRMLRRGLFSAYTTAEGLNDNVIWCVFRDTLKRLWVGGAGLAELDADGAHVVAGTEKYYLRSVIERPDGKIVAAGMPGDVLFLYDPAQRKLERLALGEYTASRVLRLLADGEHGIWAATDDAGLLYIDTGAHPSVSRIELPGGHAHEFVGDIKRDARSRLWAAGRNGLAVRDGDSWQRFTTEQGLRRDFVAYVHVRDDDSLLVGYFDPLGLAQVRYENAAISVTHLDPPAAATGSRNIYSIGEDSRHRLWVGSGRGVDIQDAHGWRHYDVADGLAGDDVNNMAFLADGNDDVWIGTSAGLARFHASAEDTLRGDPVAPAVTFVDRDVAARSTHAFDARFAALRYVAEDELVYRTRLIGLDPEFRVGADHEVHYPGLAHGSYRFEVGARTADGEWGPTASIEFEIAPEWWQTWWARTAECALLLALLTGMLRWRTARLQMRNRALELRVAARTEELRHSNSVLTGEIAERIAVEEALSRANIEQRRRTERFTLIARIAALISSNLDIRTLLQRAADAVHEVLEYPNVDIPLVDTDVPGTLLVRARGGWYKHAINRDDRLPIDGGIMGAAVRERRAQCVNDTASDPRYIRPPGTTGSHSELAVPILIGADVLGVLNVEGTAPFDDLDVASLGVVADYLAVAIENARLFENARESAILAERRRVAHDLHDNVTQILSSISMQAQALAHAAPATSLEVVSRSERLAGLARIAVSEMRTLLHELRTTHVDGDAAVARTAGSTLDLPLPDAVERLVGSMVPISLKVTYRFANYLPQQPEHEYALLRIIQEAVSNAVRHAAPTMLSIRARVQRDVCRVTVTDDGRGIDIDREPGVGHESMRARVAVFGGTVCSSSAVPSGTVVDVVLPRRDHQVAAEDRSPRDAATRTVNLKLRSAQSSASG